MDTRVVDDHSFRLTAPISELSNDAIVDILAGEVSVFTVVLIHKDTTDLKFDTETGLVVPADNSRYYTIDPIRDSDVYSIFENCSDKANDYSYMGTMDQYLEHLKHRRFNYRFLCR
jgi:hypothetical protein